MSNYSPKYVPTSYAEARELIRTRGRRVRGSSVPTLGLGHATTLEPRAAGGDPMDAPAYAIHYHATDVVTFYRNGVVALNHNGYLASTMANRWHIFTPRELRVNAVDILARRADRDPRFVVRRLHWENVTSEIDGATYARPVAGSESELFTTRASDRTTYLLEGYSPATRRSTWTLAPSAFIDAALFGK